MKELITIQSKLKAPKNNKNDFGHYNYRSAEDIYRAVKPLLEECKCYLLMNDDIVQVGDRFYIKATSTVINDAGDSTSVSAFAREPLSRKGMDDSQVTGGASSYARKYALCGLFAIDGEKDADALNVNNHYTQAKPKDENAELGLELALQNIKSATSVEELGRMYNELTAFKDNKAFISALSARKKELKP